MRVRRTIKRVAKRTVVGILIAATLLFGNVTYLPNVPYFRVSFGVEVARAATCDNLISWWSLDESSDGSGAVTRVDSHSTNNLTDNNTTASAAGKVSNGADFEATNTEYLSRADNASLSFTGDFSGWVWYDPETFDQAATILGKMTTTDNQRSYLVQVTTDQKFVIYFSDDGVTLGTTLRTTNADVAATMNHYAWAVDVSVPSATIWVNGTSVSVDSVATADTAVFDSTAEFEIGARTNGTTDYTDGIEDEVALFTGLITQTDVNAAYNSGSGASYSAVCAAAAPAQRRRLPVIF